MAARSDRKFDLQTFWLLFGKFKRERIHYHSIQKTNSLHAQIRTQSEMKHLSAKINWCPMLLPKACFPILFLILPYRNKVYFYNLLNMNL